MKCFYGCNQKAQYQFKNGKWCCSKSFNKCPENRRKNSEGGKGKKQKPFSEETKRNMSEAKKGKKNPMYDKKHSEESKRKNSESQKGKYMGDENVSRRPDVRKKISEANTGEKNGSWRGGISCEPYCPIWLDKEYKESIKERDDNKCQNPDCWGTSERICLHHINYIKKDCRPKNIITICQSCNSRANKDREWHTAWYQAIIYRRYIIKTIVGKI